MSKWYDKYDEYTASTISQLTSYVSKSFDSLLVQEGNVPNDLNIDLKKYLNPYIYRWYRLGYITHLVDNPPFLDNVIIARYLGEENPYFHIDLDLINNKEDSLSS